MLGLHNQFCNQSPLWTWTKMNFISIGISWMVLQIIMWTNHDYSQSILLRSDFVAHSAWIIIIIQEIIEIKIRIMCNSCWSTMPPTLSKRCFEPGTGTTGTEASTYCPILWRNWAHQSHQSPFECITKGSVPVVCHGRRHQWIIITIPPSPNPLLSAVRKIL